MPGLRQARSRTAHSRLFGPGNPAREDGSLLPRLRSADLRPGPRPRVRGIASGVRRPVRYVAPPDPQAEGAASAGAASDHPPAGGKLRLDQSLHSLLVKGAGTRLEPKAHWAHSAQEGSHEDTH